MNEGQRRCRGAWSRVLKGARRGGEIGSATDGARQLGRGPVHVSVGLTIGAMIGLLAGCAAAPPTAPSPATPSSPAPPPPAVAPTGRFPEVVEHPPLEPAPSAIPERAPEPVQEPAPVAPSPALPAGAPGPAHGAASTGAAEPSTTSVQPGPQLPIAPAPAPTPEAADEQQVANVIADLARYSSLAPDDVRRELTVVTAALNRQRTDANRVRLAMLYTLSRTPQDDQRALQLLETVIKGSSGSAAVKQLAGVLHAQVNERLRVAREEQQKAAAAIQKLEALRSLERSLLRDRVRGGGGGPSGGSGGGSGGGG